MKTARLLISGCLCVIFVPSTLLASGSLTIDADARGLFWEGEDPVAEWRVLGLSVRKILSDRSADRWMLFALVEMHDDLSDVMLHESYIRYKGPMSRWNVTLGRFQLPFSLLTSFSTSRLLYENVTTWTAGMDADSGLMVSGIIGDVDYGVALTQGLGAHNNPEIHELGLASGRVGWTFGDAGDITIGVSAMVGQTHGDHAGKMVDRQIIGLDGTMMAGGWTTRWEFQSGEIDNDVFAGGFAMADRAILPQLDVTSAATIMHHQNENTGAIFLGLGYRSPWFTVRGGYTYEYSETKNGHGVSIQLYRLFSLPF